MFSKGRDSTESLSFSRIFYSSYNGRYTEKGEFVMRLEKVERIDILRKRLRVSSTEILRLFDSFIASGEKYMKVCDLPAARTAQQNRNNLAASAKRYKYGILVHNWNNTVILERLIDTEETH